MMSKDSPRELEVIHRNVADQYKVKLQMKTLSI